ncbi:hypothetical protein LKO27_14175 [Tessaracoccus sp. OS52]|uniref:COG4315 family predicted lipoprotein n=1 Tax=Tessaracoccus sp. OS52 TaxID=2886691 RepID=UPI001D102190|nr:hypothetical protein [Tessaracoccus sp. OS52]MCC2594549.1 hypothetical protein [Tessaracoccus sp. OS52]
MVSLARLIHPAAAIFAAVVLASCSGAGPIEADTTPATTEATTAAPATSEPETSEPETSEPETSESESTDEASTPESSESATAPSDGALALKLADSDLGEILVDGNGLTLYLFTKDTQNADASVCEGQCLVNWPPLIGVPTEGEGVDDSKLGSFTKPDGTVQATYNGWPLYYWIGDTEPGQTTGQGVQGVWYVLDRDGDAVTG